MIAFRSMTLPLFALVAALAGCSAAETGTSTGAESVDSVQATATAEQAQKAESNEGHSARGPAFGARPGGPEFLVHAALRAPLNLTAEQKATLEGLAKSSVPQRPAFDVARASKLAAAVRSNSFEASEQKPVIDESARQARIAAAAKAMATLHDTLTPEQRSAFVDSIEKHASEHGKRDEHGAKTAMRGEHGPRMGKRHGGHAGGPMRMLAGLDLTQEQKDAIKAKLEAARPEKAEKAEKPSTEQREAMKARFESMRTEMKAKLESFKSDTFDATAFVTPSKPFARPEQLDGHRMNGLAAITSILTPAQRETLAARIEQGPAAHVKAAPIAK